MSTWPEGGRLRELSQPLQGRGELQDRGVPVPRGRRALSAASATQRVGRLRWWCDPRCTEPSDSTLRSREHYPPTTPLQCAVRSSGRCSHGTPSVASAMPQRPCIGRLRRRPSKPGTRGAAARCEASTRCSWPSRLARTEPQGLCLLRSSLFRSRTSPRSRVDGLTPVASSSWSSAPRADWPVGHYEQPMLGRQH